jgi:hypothetical protein
MQKHIKKDLDHFGIENQVKHLVLHHQKKLKLVIYIMMFAVKNVPGKLDSEQALD